MERLLRGIRRPSTYAPPIIAVLIFVVMANLLMPQVLTLIISGIDIAMTVIITALYTPVLIRSLRASDKLPDQYVVTGMLMYWIFLAISRIWFILAIMMDRPKWMSDFWLPTFCYFMIAFSGYYLIKVPSKAGRQTSWQYVIWASVLGITIVTGALVYLYKIDLRL